MKIFSLMKTNEKPHRRRNVETFERSFRGRSRWDFSQHATMMRSHALFILENFLLPRILGKWFFFIGWKSLANNNNNNNNDYENIEEKYQLQKSLSTSFTTSDNIKWLCVLIFENYFDWIHHHYNNNNLTDFHLTFSVFTQVIKGILDIMNIKRKREREREISCGGWIF